MAAQSRRAPACDVRLPCIALEHMLGPASFAFGQIAGLSMLDWIAGGLQRGLVFSALTLLIGALLALRQRALP